MPTKVKGMTSLEIAIIVGIVVTIAVAAGWYLYTTFGAVVAGQPLIRVVSGVAFTNGTIKVDIMNTGGSHVNIIGAYVFDIWYPVRYTSVHVPPSWQVTVYVDTGRWIRVGSIIQGKLITEEGYVIPFSARVLSY